MTTLVSGSLRYVSGRAEDITTVSVAAAELRTGGGGVITTSPDVFPVVDGWVEFSALPGAAILVLQHLDKPVDTVPLLVPDSASASLETCIVAARAADSGTRDVLEGLAARAAEALDAAISVKADADRAAQSAQQAQTSAQSAGASESAAKGYAQSALSDAQKTGNDKYQTEIFKQQAQAAATSAKSDADRAKASEQQAKTSATAAKTDADRSKAEADRAAQSAQDASIKAVADKVDELLAGAPDAYDTLLEIADELSRAQSAEATLLQAISQKADKIHSHTISDVVNLNATLSGKANRTHQHLLSDISDAPNLHSVLSYGSSLVSRDNAGRAQFFDPAVAEDAANKRYVDNALASARLQTPEDLYIPVVGAWADSGIYLRRLGKLVHISVVAVRTGESATLPADWRPSRGFDFMGTNTTSRNTNAWVTITDSGVVKPSYAGSGTPSVWGSSLYIMD